MAIHHDPRLYVDCTRVYHFGARYNVEMEIVLPGDMTVMESHDIALALQHKIESMEGVERAFVHVRELFLCDVLLFLLHTLSHDTVIASSTRWITRSATGWSTRSRGSWSIRRTQAVAH